MTLQNVKHIKILTLLIVPFLFSAPSLVPVPRLSNFVSPKIFCSTDEIPADAHCSSSQYMQKEGPCFPVTLYVIFEADGDIRQN